MIADANQKKLFRWVSAFFIFLLFLFIILRLDNINSWLNYALFVLRPVLIGLVIAYLCNPIFRMFERKAFSRISSFRFKRSVSLLCTYIVLFLIFFTLIMLIVPQLISSILDFLGSYEAYLQTALGSANDIVGMINGIFSTEIQLPEYEIIRKSIADFLANMELQSFLESMLTYSTIEALFSMIGEVFFIFTDIIFGLFISVYILSTKENLYAYVMRLRKAVFPEEINARITSVCTIADRSFGGFIRGKLLDSTIVGVMVYIIISIMKVPYAILIAVIIGITDIVPVVGPFIGVIPSAVIILLTDPIKVIPFLLTILIVQQIDGNIMAPKILGENTGVSSLCVIIAITIMGAIWGLVGMVVGVPLFATILELTDKYLNKKLHSKGISADAISKEELDKADTSHQKKADGGIGTLTEGERRRILAFTLATRHHTLTESNEAALSAFAKEYAEATQNKKSATSNGGFQESNTQIPEV